MCEPIVLVLGSSRDLLNGLCQLESLSSLTFVVGFGWESEDPENVISVSFNFKKQTKETKTKTKPNQTKNELL